MNGPVDFSKMMSLLQMANWQEENKRNALIRDYMQGNIIPPPQQAPQMGPMDLVGPKPLRLNQNGPWPQMAPKDPQKRLLLAEMQGYARR